MVSHHFLKRLYAGKGFLLANREFLADLPDHFPCQFPRVNFSEGSRNTSSGFRNSAKRWTRKYIAINRATACLAGMLGVATSLIS